MNSARRTMLRATAMCALMLAAAGASVTLKPTTLLADQLPPIDLERLVPTHFGDWRALPTKSSPAIINPIVEQSLRALYSQTLARTYVNGNGYQLMLALAYGGDQSRELQVHRPEVCYAAQGFQVSDMQKVDLSNGPSATPAMQLLATAGARAEPITYWVRIGKQVVRGNVEQGFARLRHGLRGYIADGLVFRVSSIDTNSENAFKHHQDFVGALNVVSPPENRRFLFGWTRH